jgi:HK97 family phage portal protein
MKYSQQTLYDKNGVKALIHIPGWAEILAQNADAGSDVAQAYSKSPWARRCVAIRSNALSAIPWTVQSGSTPVGTDHPAQELLQTVNLQTNWIDHIRATEADLNVYGKSYWLKIIGKSSKAVLFLRRLNPISMTIVVGETGIEKFVQKIKGKVVGEWGPEKMLYFHDYDPLDDFGGVSPTKVALPDIETEIAAGAYLRSFFENYAMPAVIMTTPDTVGQSALQELKQLWDRWFRGAEKGHKTAWADRGLKPSVIGYSLEELAMAEVRLEARRAIATAYEVPLSIAGGSESINFATLRESHLQLYFDAILPRSEYIKGVIDANLLKQHFSGDLSFVWNPDELPIMIPNVAEERESIGGLVRDGVITAAAGAEKLGFNPDEVGQGPISIQVQGQIEPPEEAKEALEDEGLEVLPTGMQKALRLWQRKTLKRFERRGNAKAPFSSKHIPAMVHDAIEEKLNEAGSSKEIAEIFERAGR